jgi:hypothetical protein
MQTTTIQSTSLHYREGNSDKVYQAAIEPKDDGYIVTFAYHPPFPRLRSGHPPFQRPSPQKQFPSNDAFVRLDQQRGLVLGVARLHQRLQHVHHVVGEPLAKDEALALREALHAL